MDDISYIDIHFSNLYMEYTIIILTTILSINIILWIIYKMYIVYRNTLALMAFVINISKIKTFYIKKKKKKTWIITINTSKYSATHFL